MVNPKTRISLRLDFADTVRIGPGKVQLLEPIAELGSIGAAGRVMGMSYLRAQMLVDSLIETEALPFSVKVAASSSS